MSDTSPDAAPAVAESGVSAAWAILIFLGGTTVVFNIWHATHWGHMRLPLALLYGIAPVVAAMGLSHIVATHKSGLFLHVVAFAVMLGAMGLSIGAISAVIRPAAGPVLCWLFGAVLDAASLVALRVILSERALAAAVRAASEKAREEAAEAARITAAGVAVRDAAAAALSAPPATVPAPAPEAAPEPPARAPRKADPDYSRKLPRGKGRAMSPDQLRPWAEARIGAAGKASRNDLKNWLGIGDAKVAELWALLDPDEADAPFPIHAVK